MAYLPDQFSIDDISLKRRYPFQDDDPYEGGGFSDQFSSDPAYPTNIQTNEIHQESNDLMLYENTENTICYGTIIGEQVKMLNNQIQQYIWALHEALTLDIVTRGQFFSLELKGTKLGLLTRDTCSRFSKVVEKHTVYMQAYITSQNRRVAQMTWQWDRQPIWPLEINIYGSRGDADAIGRTLSESKMFLQRPSFGLDGYEYYNPHFLDIPGYFDHREQQDRAAAARAPPTETSSLVRDNSTGVANRENVTDTIDNIIDSLSYTAPQHQAIAQVSGLQSSLLPHQKEAVDFVSRQESGQIPLDQSLWRLHNANTDRAYYQHMFTKTKNAEPIEANGGIIADEMGLGKSLVILSTIASSIDRAEQFVSAAESQQAGRKMPSKATLVVAPSSLLIDSWINEINSHFRNGTLDFHKHLGRGRKQEKDRLRSKLVIFTTYATIATEKLRGDTTLSDISWFRIVLDEAHDIRNPKTKQFGAIANLSAQHRWCLTGTPIQNSLDDLSALVTFIQMPVMKIPSTFRQYITTPITNTHQYGNLQRLLKTICIRRTRQLLNIPEPVPQNRILRFSNREREEYDALMERCKHNIDQAVGRDRKSKINSAVLQSILRLRLFCNNGRADLDLKIGPDGQPSNPEMALGLLRQNGEDVCAYCSRHVLDVGVSAEKTDSGIFIPHCCHLVCPGCVLLHRERGRKCPTCVVGMDNSTTAHEIAGGSSQEQETMQQDDEETSLLQQRPTKLLQLLEDLRREPNHKSIVFSEWKKTLKIVQRLLQSVGIRYEIIHGSKTLDARKKVLVNFRKPNGPNVLLMTLGTGAVGLNLAVATRVYLLEPQWNPSIESQAIGRALRLGQTDQVVIVRYIMKKTIEESDVWSRQKRKIALAGGGFGNAERIQAFLGTMGIDASIVSERTRS